MAIFVSAHLSLSIAIATVQSHAFWPQFHRRGNLSQGKVVVAVDFAALDSPLAPTLQDSQQAEHDVHRTPFTSTDMQRSVPYSSNLSTALSSVRNAKMVFPTVPRRQLLHSLSG